MNAQQTPDTRAGAYYVSAIDGPRTYLMAGPYDQHADALANVDRALSAANDIDPRAWFMAWGTVRYDEPQGSGRLNQRGVM